MTIRCTLALVATLLVASTPIAPASAASFDCSKATRPDEFAVCANPDLSALDSEMGGLWYAYNAFPFLMGMSGARRDEARAFLQNRAACGANVPCLRAAYVARNQMLKTQITQAMQSCQF